MHVHAGMYLNIDILQLTQTLAARARPDPTLWPQESKQLGFGFFQIDPTSSWTNSNIIYFPSDITAVEKR